MNLMIISDLHGSLASSQKALAIFEKSGADKLLILGDILARGNWQNRLDHQPQAVADLLSRQAQNISAVQGNCDSPAEQKLLDFPLEPVLAQVSLGTRQVFFSHGHIYNADNLPDLDRDDLFLFGHSHIAGIWLKTGHILANPGSISLPKAGLPPSYALLDQATIQIKDFSGNILFQQEL